MAPTEGEASAPTRSGRCGSQSTLCRQLMRCSSASRVAFNSCGLKQRTARAALVAVGLLFLQLQQCSGGASASSLAPHLATTAPLTTPSTADSSRRSEFVGWRGRRRQGSTESRTLLAGTVGLVSDSAGKCGDAGREEHSGEWRRCCTTWSQQNRVTRSKGVCTWCCRYCCTARELRLSLHQLFPCGGLTPQYARAALSNNFFIFVNSLRSWR